MKGFKLYPSTSKRYKKYRGYKGGSKYSGRLLYTTYKTKIARLNNYADNKDRKGFLTYVNNHKKPRRLFNLWKGQRNSYLNKKDIDMIDSAMGDRW